MRAYANESSLPASHGAMALGDFTTTREKGKMRRLSDSRNFEISHVGVQKVATSQSAPLKVVMPDVGVNLSLQSSVGGSTRSWHGVNKIRETKGGLFALSSKSFPTTLADETSKPMLD